MGLGIIVIPVAYPFIIHVTVAGIAIMFDDPFDIIEKVDITEIRHLYGHEKTQFINYIHEDYEHCLRKKQHPDLIKYYRDVLTKLIKTYGH